MKNLLFILLLIFTLNGYTQLLDTPEKISNYLIRNFKYKADEKEYWQTPEETIERKKGDCEDFAFLSRKLLNDAGFKADAYLIYFPPKKAHVFCVFYDHRIEQYALIDNLCLYPYYNQNLIRLIEKTYRPLEQILLIKKNNYYGYQTHFRQFRSIKSIKKYNPPLNIGRFKL